MKRAILNQTGGPFQAIQAPDMDSFRSIVDQLSDRWVFRGQGNADWPLITSLDRHLSQPLVPQSHQAEAFEESCSNVLKSFLDASLGRVSHVPISQLSDNHMLALGQHYGLKTPLLDWSESPYLALFFAIADPVTVSVSACSVWCADTDALPEFLRLGSRNVTFEAIRSDLNPRILAQRGLFSRMSGGGCLASAVTETVAGLGLNGHSTYPCCLLKISVSTKTRTQLLRSLLRMNLSWLTVYPDLEGAARFANESIIKG